MSSVSLADELVLLPERVVLNAANATQLLLLEQRSGDEYTGEVRDGIEFSSSDETVVRVADGQAIAVGDGQARITARVGEQVARADVFVTGTQQPAVVSFRNDVLSVFSKAGCNAGACHGALAGKGGFRLSLRGYAPQADYATIAEEARGRRIELNDPGRSLILAKPSGAIPHKGGLRLDVGSDDYRLIAQWIAEGAEPPRDEDRRVERIDVLPARVMLRAGGEQRVIVQATYTDGTVRDVTRWAKLESATAAVATIDESGQVSVVGPGEGAITAWFASKIAVARVTVPYPDDLPDEVYAALAANNYIDQYVLTQLRRLNLPPSPPADDATFIRRAYIDTTGSLPPVAEVDRFLADQAPDKRQRLVDALLASPQFADYWAYKWSDMLLINGRSLRPQAVESYYKWIRERVEENTPWDELARQVVTAEGSSIEHGATNFYALHQDPETMSENLCQAFLGLSIGCAKCHNHPLEKWTNDQYYAMANLLARVRAKGWGGDGRGGDGIRTLFVAESGELLQPSTGKPQPPTPLDGEPLPDGFNGDRRVPLARWLTAPDNPYFARAITNRIWANFFGVGLVEPVDDLRASNPASNEALLSAAADALVASDFDLKTLMRSILLSATYARSSEPLPENAAETRFYSRYYPRRMMAEALHDAICQVTGVPSRFTHIAFPAADREETKFYPEGTRALALYDAAVESPFLQAFGRNPRTITCECERSNEPSLVQVLHIANGDTLNEKLATAGSRVDLLLESGLPDDQLIEDVFLTALARPPTDQELRQFLSFFDAAAPDERRVVLEDLFWSVMSSREFLFQH